MNPPPSHPEDPIEALLREANQHIPDNGFTRRVIASLPKRSVRGRWRARVLAIATLLSGALAVWQLPSPSLVSDLLALGWRPAAPQLIPLLVPMLLALAALGWSVYALITEDV